jgi:hypothetical protein
MPLGIFPAGVGADDWHTRSADSYFSAADTYLRCGKCSGTVMAVHLDGVGDCVVSNLTTAITGDLDVRVRCTALDWTPASAQYLASHAVDATHFGWGLRLLATGAPDFLFTVNGSTFIQHLCTASLPGVVDRVTDIWVRVTFDADDGAGNAVTKFYTSSDGSTWTQLGSTVTDAAGPYTLYSPVGTGMKVGAYTAAGLGGLPGRFYSAEIRDGIGGTIVASPDFTTWAAQQTSKADAQGNTWTLVGNAWVGMGGTLKAGFRVPSVTIPQGARILSARIIHRGVAGYSQSITLGDKILRFYAEDTDNAVAPTSYAEAEALTLTSAYLYWRDLHGITGTVDYQSPNLAAVIQEIVDRPGWVSGNAMQIVAQPDPACGDWNAFDLVAKDAALSPPALQIIWTTDPNAVLVAKMIEVAGDSGAWWGSSFAAGICYFGKTATTPYGGFVRIPMCPIPKGSTVHEAWLAGGMLGQVTTVNANVYGNDTDNAVAPTTAAQGEALALTAAVAWNAIPACPVASYYKGHGCQSPDIAAPLQTIVNRAGYASGNAVQFVLRDNGSSTYANRGWYGTAYGLPGLITLWAIITPPANTAVTNVVGQGEDTYYWTGANGWYGIQVQMGKSGATSLNTILRRRLRVPRGATILTAVLRQQSISTLSAATCNVRVRAVLQADNSTDLTAATAADLAALPQTVAYVDWNALAAQTANVGVAYADIAAVIQEIVLQTSWASGNRIALLLLDNGSSTNAYRNFPNIYIHSVVPWLEVTYALHMAGTGQAAGQPVAATTLRRRRLTGSGRAAAQPVAASVLRHRRIAADGQAAGQPSGRLTRTFRTSAIPRPAQPPTIPRPAQPSVIARPAQPSTIPPD